MKKAVMYGAGNIGRGFIGKLMSESGYEVCFIDIAQDLIARFNRQREYRVRIVSNEEERYDVVKNVCAVDANSAAAAERIAECDLMASAVGVRVLPHIVDNIVRGIILRMARGGRPLDIILAENQLEADRLMREYIYAKLNEEQRAWADQNLGLVEASIGRMVPPLTPEERAEDPLLIAVEPYAELPVDSEAFAGKIPDLKGIVPYSPFGYYIKRKLFIHNMGHALCAYFGWQRGYEYIWQAIADPQIRKLTELAMTDAAIALHNEYGIPLSEIMRNVEDLLNRFGNRALKDTVARVGGDPIRKLRADDRLVGAALYCLEQGCAPVKIAAGIVAAIYFAPETDAAAIKIKREIQENGIAGVMERYMGLAMDSTLGKIVTAEAQKYMLCGSSIMLGPSVAL